MSASKVSIKPVRIDGTYIELTHGKLTLTANSILNQNTLETLPVRVKTSNDRDISTSLDGKTGYVREVYLKFDNQEISTSIAIQGCVLEYRSTAGTNKKFNKSGRKWDGVYLHTYACVGIPLSVFQFIVKKIDEENPGLDWDHGASVFNDEKDGYVWPRPKMNVTPGKPDTFSCMVYTGDRIVPFDPIVLMKKTSKSLIGVAMFSFRLKKVADNPRECARTKFTTGMSLTSFQVTDFTLLTGPGITHNMPATGFKGYEASSEMINNLNRLTLDDDDDDDDEGSTSEEGEEDDEKNSDHEANEENGGTDKTSHRGKKGKHSSSKSPSNSQS